MKPLAIDQKELLRSLSVGLILVLAVTAALLAILFDSSRLDYEGSHAVRNAAFKLSTTIYDNQVRKIREDTLREIGYQEGWNDCVMRLVPELRRRP